MGRAVVLFCAVQCIYVEVYSRSPSAPWKRGDLTDDLPPGDPMPSARTLQTRFDCLPTSVPTSASMYVGAIIAAAVRHLAATTAVFPFFLRGGGRAALLLAVPRAWNPTRHASQAEDP